MKGNKPTVSNNQSDVHVITMEALRGRGEMFRSDDPFSYSDLNYLIDNGSYFFFSFFSICENT